MPPSEDEPVVLSAGCKVNLFLRVTGRREDGYHTLESLFWPLPLPSDTLEISRASGKGLRFSCSDHALETPDNSIVKAYEAYAAATAFAPAISVFLRKNIPHGAGLGGGSSDAAALLVFLNTLARSENANPLDAQALEELGARLGADVPFFFHNTPSMVRGIGEHITPAPRSVVDGLRGIHLVLVCPDVRVSTAWAFGAWDEKHFPDLTNGNEKDTSPLVHGLPVHNDLCCVVFERYPELEKILASLGGTPADAVCMSGTGSSIFGLFAERDLAEHAVRFFQHSGERVFHHVL